MPAVIWLFNIAAGWSISSLNWKWSQNSTLAGPKRQDTKRSSALLRHIIHFCIFGWLQIAPVIRSDFRFIFPSYLILTFFSIIYCCTLFWDVLMHSPIGGSVGCLWHQVASPRIIVFMIVGCSCSACVCVRCWSTDSLPVKLVDEAINWTFSTPTDVVAVWSGLIIVLYIF